MDSLALFGFFGFVKLIFFFVFFGYLWSEVGGFYRRVLICFHLCFFLFLLVNEFQPSSFIVSIVIFPAIIKYIHEYKCAGSDKCSVNKLNFEV